MNILSWNVRGLNSKGRLSDVRKVVSTCKAEIVGLVETMVKKEHGGQ